LTNLQIIFFRRVLFILISAALLGFPLFLVLGSITINLLASDNFSETYDEHFLHFSQLVTDPIESLSQQDLLLPIPLFTVTGFLLAETGMPSRMLSGTAGLLDTLNIPVRFGIPGAVLLIACFFTPLTGASGVTIVALGGLLVPVLVQAGVSEKAAIGLVTASGSIGLLIFPSLPVILYGMMSGNEAPINEVYIAGIIPTVLLVIFPFLYIISGQNRDIRYSINYKKLGTEDRKKLFCELLIIPTILLLFFLGKLTVSEIGVLVFLWYFTLMRLFRELNKQQTILAITESMVLVGSMLAILIFAMGMTRYLLLLEFPQAVFVFISSFINNQWVFLILLNIFLLFVGAFMDIFSAIIVFTPLIIPLAQGYDISMVHLAIIVLMNLEIGYLTPPVGINLFLSSFRFKKPVSSIVKSTFPYFILFLFLQLIITYVPLLLSS
jgi:C4-dicarboxylate transporter, DctM subunit